MNILITGANGYLGSRFVNYFDKYHVVRTLSKNNSDYNIDLAYELPTFTDAFDLVIHAAGKAHISYPSTTLNNHFHDVNVIGTKNLLNSFNKNNLPKKFIFISSVAVYGLEKGEKINEDAPLLASDPYGLSKILAEQLVIDWGIKNGVIISILRLPLIVGLNPPGNLGSMIQGIKNGYYFNIGNGSARRSMVLLTDVLEHTLVISKFGGIYNLTDDYDPSFSEISNSIANSLGRRRCLKIPFFIALFIAKMGDFLTFVPLNSKKIVKLTSTLTFDCNKAKNKFGWSPQKVINYDFKS